MFTKNKKFTKKDLTNAIPIALGTIVIYYYWFIFSDRRRTFLYGHLHSNPYDNETMGRYLIAGLIVSGALFIIYTLINLLIKKIKPNYQLPNWKRVEQLNFLLSFLPIFLILIYFGQPTLPIVIAVASIIILNAGISLALYLSNYIIDNFRQAIFTFLYGLSIVPILILFPLGIDFGLRKNILTTPIIISTITIVFSLLWLIIMTFISKKMKQPIPSTKNILLSSLMITYGLGPLLHYFVSHPNYPYISNSGNFFSSHFFIQILAWTIALGILWLIMHRQEKHIGKEVKHIFITLILLAVVTYGATFLAADKNKNVWVCQENQWLKQGEPTYQQPFAEECGLIDKAMGL
ncbi:MAG: hypothetical protein Q4G02_01260 [bacterium]|nr:hypothetical protein [bacterium]